MGKREYYEPGTFCWVDLTTTDAVGAKAFYGDLLGWEFRDDEIPGCIYTKRHGDAVGAIDQQDEHPPHWNNYVSVTSAEETAARAGQRRWMYGLERAPDPRLRGGGRFLRRPLRLGDRTHRRRWECCLHHDQER